MSFRTWAISFCLPHCVFVLSTYQHCSFNLPVGFPVPIFGMRVVNGTNFVSFACYSIPSSYSSYIGLMNRVGLQSLFVK